MVKYEIIWTPRSKIDLYNISEFYGKRNGTYNYSKKIYTKIKRSVLILRRYSGIGVKTNIYNVRNLIVGDFCLFYRINDKSILIIAVWDSKRNPNNLNLT
jgi:plasmid stabilization system protein ParE